MIETAPELKPQKRTVPNGSSAPRWSRYKAVDPHPCDFCKFNQVDNPLAPVARRARHRRKANTDPTDLLLCDKHAQDQRVVDGLPPIKVLDGTLRWVH